MAFDNNVAKLVNSSEIIFSLIHGGTGGSDTLSIVADNGVQHTALVLLTTAGGITLDDVVVFCCSSSETSDKASVLDVESSPSGVVLLMLGVDPVA